MNNFSPKVKIGVPKWANLTPEQQSFLEALHLRLETEGIGVMQGLSGMDIGERVEKLKKCQGVIVLGFATWSAERIFPRKSGEKLVFVSDFVQIYTTLALALSCPLLVLVEKAITPRGILRQHFVPEPLKLPRNLDPTCLENSAIAFRFGEWIKTVKAQKQIFFGYSKSVTAIADKLRAYLKRIGVSVLDWQTDFDLTDAIYSQMKRAAAETVCSVFLLTRQENTLDSGTQSPADNLIFEIGYFAAAHGKENTVIILEDGVNVPDHLRGYIFIPLRNREQLRTVQDELRRSVSTCLAGV